MVRVALLHYPMNNKRGEEIATSITNIDLHDIARSSKTYGVHEYYLVHPLKIQTDIAGRIAGHWHAHSQKDYNLDRSDAFSLVRFAKSFEELRELLPRTRFIATSAKRSSVIPSVTFQELRGQIAEGFDCLVAFGTGHGMSDGLLRGFDSLLEPIVGPTDYNHLSVRSAAAIVMDRLLGK